MRYGGIVKAVEQVKSRYNEDDPVRLCKAMGIVLIYQSFGTAADAIKGFMIRIKRIDAIIVNSDMSPILQRIIIAHELGHAVLHKDSSLFPFREIALFDESSRYEKEANLFAAEYILDDDSVMEALNTDNTFFSAAAGFNVPMEFLDFKFRIMKWKGYKVVKSPITSKSNFLRDLEVPDNKDDYCG